MSKAINEMNKLLDECEELRDIALNQADDAIKVLNKLGFQYRLVQDQVDTRTAARKLSRRPRADRDCPICGFQTDPPHDRRSHRSQSTKAPFSDAELTAKGLRRLDRAATS